MLWVTVVSGLLVEEQYAWGLQD